MVDKEKILRGAECCKYVEPSDNRCPEECPYLPDGHLTCGLNPLLDDVITLLKIVEPTEIVRCKNCRHYDIECITDSCGWCDRRDFGTNDEWFCADGEAGTYAVD